MLFCVSKYKSPLGKITLLAKEDSLLGLWFDNQKYYAGAFAENLCNAKNEDSSVILQTKKWLDEYFKGNVPDFIPKLELIGTPFRKEVWNILQTIPYGETVTYKYVAEQVANKQGEEKMSAQAVGGAVGHNPISIIVPCHRVVASNGELTGYAGGLERKQKLLEIEKGLTIL